MVFCGNRPADEQVPCLNDALAVLDTNMATILGRGVGSFGDDANAEGYRVIADEFTKVLPRLDGPPVVASPPSPPPTVPAPVSPAMTAPPARPVGAVPAYTG